MVQTRRYHAVIVDSAWYHLDRYYMTSVGHESKTLLTREHLQVVRHLSGKAG